VLVAYYPSAIPDPFREMPVNMRVLVHLAGEEVGVTRTTEILGIQGKRKTVRKSIPEGVGTSGFIKKLAYPAYAYEGVEPGFAEHDLEEFDKVAWGLAWTRSLDAVRKGFRAEVDIERVWDDHVECEFLQVLHIPNLLVTRSRADTGACQWNSYPATRTRQWRQWSQGRM
jgi:hypothetical protein